MAYLPNLATANQQVYATLLPASLSNPQIGPRIVNKLNFADQNTRVVVEWRDDHEVLTCQLHAVTFVVRPP